MKKNILFICRDHSARAPMAAAMINQEFNQHFFAQSTGIRAEHPSSLAIDVMREIGVHMPDAPPQKIEDLLEEDIHLVITLCQDAKMQCPKFPRARGYAHKGFRDPGEPERETPHEEEIRGSFRSVRDEIRLWLGKYF